MRADAHRQYLKPVSGRSNLTIVTEARTLGIELEKNRGEPVAKGVIFATDGPDSERHAGGTLLPFIVCSKSSSPLAFQL